MDKVLIAGAIVGMIAFLPGLALYWYLRTCYFHSVERLTLSERVQFWLKEPFGFFKFILNEYEPAHRRKPLLVALAICWGLSLIGTLSAFGLGFLH